ncbi:MAG: hypothetical protein H6839_07870 [Planctomycetes bacterium]|nr:hypothetical protein [Planctomycetota bacterium]
MSNKRYRRLPGAPVTQEDRNARNIALEMLEEPLREINDEISVVQQTADLYKAEVRERVRRSPYTPAPKRWEIAPTVGLRAITLLRSLREKRDAMIAEAEEHVLGLMEEAGTSSPPPAENPAAQETPPNPGKKTDAEPKKQPVHSSTSASSPEQAPAATTTSPPTKARDPAAA